MPIAKGTNRGIEFKMKMTEIQRQRKVEAMRKWQAANPGKTAHWKLSGQRRVRRRLIDDMGGKCVTCGFEDWRALQVDHINGGGRKDPLYGGSRYAYAKVILANPDLYQLLCANCNWIKRYENKEHGPVNFRTED